MPYNFHAALTKAMPLQRATCVADDAISPCSPVKRKPAAAQAVQVTSKDVADKTVPRFREFLHQPEPDYRIAIPSHDRSERLCTGTLALLRRHGVDMKRVYVFVDPVATTTEGSPQWFEYLKALTRHDFLDVNLYPGAKGLAAQLNLIFSWEFRDTS